ncbi:MAG: hypothetical protein ACR2J8_00630 [Thermomicrobiales bacterium]
MADQELLDGLIATYRELNFRVRTLPEDRLRLNTGHGSVRDVIKRLRDHELSFSQALKDSQIGIAMPDVFAGEPPIVAPESLDENTSTILAQFGTARESTLAMLRALPPMDWNKPAGGGASVETRASELLQNDRRVRERLVQLLGSPA